MSSFTREQICSFTQPLCTPAQYHTKLQNLERAEQSFRQRDEFCGGLPVHLHVEVSANCNLRCPICPQGRRLIDRGGLLSFEAFARVFGLLSPTLANIMISGWGNRC